MLTDEHYTFQNLTPFERRRRLLEHLEALVFDGVIAEPEGIQLYKTAIKMMAMEYWRNIDGSH